MVLLMKQTQAPVTTMFGMKSATWPQFADKGEGNI